MIPNALRRSLQVFLSAAAAALITSNTFGYALENKSWPTGSVISFEMELGIPSQALLDGSATWNEAAVPALYDWNAEMADVQMVAVMDSKTRGLVRRRLQFCLLCLDGFWRQFRDRRSGGDLLPDARRHDDRSRRAF